MILGVTEALGNFVALALAVPRFSETPERGGLLQESGFGESQFLKFGDFGLLRTAAE